LNFLKTTYYKLFAGGIEVPEALRGNYYPVLDGMRGVAILIVLLAHLGLNRYLWKFKFYLVSNTGVSMFFVLSGFLITTLLLKELLQTGEISLKRFYIRRALRILPVAYLFLVVLIMLNQVYSLNIGAAHFIASFLFYKNLPMPNEPYTAHFWSLAVEEQFYLTFPVLLAANVNRYTLIAISIAVIVPVIAILSYLGLGILHNNMAGQLLSKFCMYAFWKGPVIILIGSVGALLMFKGIFKPERLRANYFLSFILLILGIEITAINFPFYTKYVSEYLSALLISASIVLCIGRNDFLSWLLNNAFLRRIGILSYSIYIWQELFIGTGSWQPWLHPLAGYPEWLMIIIKLGAIAAIVAASYLFESVFLKMKDKYSYNRAGIK
jgi:peptidoglycan/LPS O-acetylase OafA/YrhL